MPTPHSKEILDYMSLSNEVLSWQPANLILPWQLPLPKSACVFYLKVWVSCIEPTQLKPHSPPFHFLLTARLTGFLKYMRSCQNGHTVLCTFLSLYASVKLSKLLVYPTDGNFNCSVFLLPNPNNCFPCGHIYAEKCKLFWKFKCRKSYTITEILVQFTHISEQTPRLPPGWRMLPFWWPSALHTVSVMTVTKHTNILKGVSGNARKHEGLFSRIFHFWRSRLSR